MKVTLEVDSYGMPYIRAHVVITDGKKEYLGEELEIRDDFMLKSHEFNRMIENVRKTAW